MIKVTLNVISNLTMIKFERYCIVIYINRNVRMFGKKIVRLISSLLKVKPYSGGLRRWSDRQ